MKKTYSAQLIKEVAIEVIAGANARLEAGEPLVAGSLLEALHQLLQASPEYCAHWEQTWEQVTKEE